MIEKSITLIESRLNNYLRQKFSLEDNIVIASNFVDSNGSVEKDIENKVVISLVDLEQEKFLKNVNTFRLPDPVKGQIAKPLNLSLLLLLACNFNSKNYKTGLKYLSNIIFYFQEISVFTATNSPEIYKLGIQKISLEMYHPDSDFRSSLWSSLGVHYLPSIIYKIRIVSAHEHHESQDISAHTQSDSKIVTNE